MSATFQMKSSNSKIFGIGLSKTGTSSLDGALNELGIRSIHFPYDWTTYHELTHGNYRLTLLDTYQAITDIVVSPFYPQLDHIYPHSKFILTIRDIDSWLESVRDHWEFMWQWAPHDRRFRQFLEYITACVYGCHTFQRERFIYVYNQHLKSVGEYFADRPHDLLTLNVCAGDGWEKLCSFLAVPVPAHPFPCANRREDKIGRKEWISMLKRAVHDLNAVIPAHKRYVIIDEQQLSGSAIDDPSRAKRLMERDGLYWGPPADSATAIIEIEKLRAQGFDYLIVAWPAFWWLDRYQDWRRFVEDQFEKVLENERLLILRMRKLDR